MRLTRKMMMLVPRNQGHSRSTRRQSGNGGGGGVLGFDAGVGVLEAVVT